MAPQFAFEKPLPHPAAAERVARYGKRDPLQLNGGIVMTVHYLRLRRGLRAPTQLALPWLLCALIMAVLAGPTGPRAAHGQPPQAGPQEPAGAGLYFRRAGAAEGGVAGEAVLSAPLVHAEVEVAVHGPIARTTVRQYFINPSEDWMEGVYVFPLPENSAVDRMTLVVGQRRIEGEIHERQQARRIYEQAKAEGRRAGLLTSERPNVFTTAIANVGPQQAISVEIAYQERVGYDAGWYELRLPLVVAPRYTPGGPRLVMVPMPPRQDDARPLPIAAGPDETAEPADVFGPVIDPASGRLVPTAAISVDLDAGLPLQDIESPSHPLRIETLTDGKQRIELAAGPVAGDRDFVLRWQPAVGSEPRAALFAQQVGPDSFLLATLLPDPAASGAPAQQRQPRDLILVVDNSGSMFGASMDQAKAAVALALERLAPEDRVNVIRFDDQTERLFERAKPASAATLQEARRFVESLRADGGTEMLPALQAALGEPTEPGRLSQIVFVTDGSVTNEDALFEVLAAGLGERRLFTVGIGSAPNSWFMTKAAELGRGSFTFIDSSEKVADRMAALFRKLERPAMTHLEAAWQEVGSVEMVPSRLPDLYAGEPVELAARIPNVPLDRLGGSLVLEGQLDGETWRATLPLDSLESAEGVSAIWARSRLGELENGLSHGLPESDVRARAVPLALEHRLVTRWTSLVAVEREEVARPAGAPLETRTVARALPYGWSHEKVFGTPGAVEGSPRLQQALALRPAAPAELVQTGVFGSGNDLALPQTATDTPWRTLTGALALLGGLVLLAVARRRRRPGGGHSCRG